MPPFTGHPTEKPKTPGALRVYELLQIFVDASSAWDNFVTYLARGYGRAWDRQNEVLGDIRKKIEDNEARAMFILSILTAGVGGGLVGGSYPEFSPIPGKRPKRGSLRSPRPPPLPMPHHKSSAPRLHRTFSPTGVEKPSNPLALNLWTITRAL